MKIKTVWPLVILLISCLLSVVQADESTVVFQVNESAPYWTQKNAAGGLGWQIVSAISKEMGIKTRIEFIPLKRLIADTSNNDVGNPLFYMSNQDFSAIIPIGVTYSALFAYQNNAHKLVLHSLHKKNRIGLLSGTIDNRSNLFNIGEFEESNSKESLFKKLKAGRLDIVLELDLVGHETIDTLFPQDVKNFDGYLIPESAAPIAIMLDSNLPDGVILGKRYKEGLKRIMKKGIYQKILQKYYAKTIHNVPTHYYDDLAKFETLYSSDLGGNGL